MAIDESIHRRMQVLKLKGNSFFAPLFSDGGKDILVVVFLLPERFASESKVKPKKKTEYFAVEAVAEQVKLCKLLLRLVC